MKKGKPLRQRNEGREKNQESKLTNRLEKASLLIRNWEKLRSENPDRNYDEYIRSAIDEYTAIIGEL
jgi:hypothetical protein